MAKSGAVLESASTLARPVLKGRHNAWVKKHLTGAIVYAFAWVIAVKILVNEPRKRAYAEYYKWVPPKKYRHDRVNYDLITFKPTQELRHRRQLRAHS